MTLLYPSLAAYVVAASLMTLTPGLDTALVLRTAAAEGARRAALAGAGVALGCFAWAAIVAAGLGALLAASHEAYAALRWLGAAYLMWVGYRMLRRPRSRFVMQDVGRRSGASAFATGLLTNLLNPKVGLFYVSFLPQFVPSDVAAGPYMLMLGAIHAALGLAWFACLILATRAVSRTLAKPGFMRAMDRATGGLFLSFGAALAWESTR